MHGRRHPVLLDLFALDRLDAPAAVVDEVATEIRAGQQDQRRNTTEPEAAIRCWSLEASSRQRGDAQANRSGIQETMCESGGLRGIFDLHLQVVGEAEEGRGDGADYTGRRGEISGLLKIAAARQASPYGESEACRNQRSWQIGGESVQRVAFDHRIDRRQPPTDALPTLNPAQSGRV